MTAPGTLEGDDGACIGSTLFVGRSACSNDAGHCTIGARTGASGVRGAVDGNTELLASQISLHVPGKGHAAGESRLGRLGTVRECAGDRRCARGIGRRGCAGDRRYCYHPGIVPGNWAHFGSGRLARAPDRRLRVAEGGGRGHVHERDLYCIRGRITSPSAIIQGCFWALRPRPKAPERPRNSRMRSSSASSSRLKRRSRAGDSI